MHGQTSQVARSLILGHCSTPNASEVHSHFVSRSVAICAQRRPFWSLYKSPVCIYIHLKRRWQVFYGADPSVHVQARSYCPPCNLLWQNGTLVILRLPVTPLGRCANGRGLGEPSKEGKSIRNYSVSKLYKWKTRKCPFLTLRAASSWMRPAGLWHMKSILTMLSFPCPLGLDEQPETARFLLCPWTWGRSIQS